MTLSPEEKGSTASISQRDFSFLVCFLTRPRYQSLKPNCCSFTPILSIPVHTQSNHPQTAGGGQGSLWGVSRLSLGKHWETPFRLSPDFSKALL